MESISVFVGMDLAQTEVLSAFMQWLMLQPNAGRLTGALVLGLSVWRSVRGHFAVEAGDMQEAIVGLNWLCNVAYGAGLTDAVVILRQARDELNMDGRP